MENKTTLNKECDINYSDQSRKGLFKGSGVDYIRMRADKHKKMYGLPKQAQHLHKLADEIEGALDELKKIKESAIERHLNKPLM